MTTARELADVVSNGRTTENVLSGRRNLIINGAMQVAQRGTTFTQTNNAYHLDRWLIQNSNDVNQQVTQSTDVPSNQGFKNSIKWAVYGSNKVGLSELRQKVEDTLVANGRSVTLSFWAKCDIANIHSVGIRDNVNATSVTISNTAWTYYTLTRDNINSTSVLDVIIYANGNTASVGDALWITGVQLELGSVATPFEYRSYGEELALCQRYYQTSYAAGTPAGTAFGGSCYKGENALSWFGSTPAWTNPAFKIVFPVEMRATPTVTWYGPNTGASGKAGGTYCGSSTDALTIHGTNVSTKQLSHYAGSGGYSAPSEGSWLANWTVDAEL